MIEKWETISPAPDYEVSDFGNVRRKEVGINLRPGINPVTGYRLVALMCGNPRKAKTFSLHRIIAIAFIPNPEKLPFINHKDCNKLNNSLNNLEWCTRQQNITHAKENALIAIGSRIGISKLDESKVKEIRTMLKFGVKQRLIAKKFGVAQTIISRINTCAIWNHVTVRNHEISNI